MSGNKGTSEESQAAAEPARSIHPPSRGVWAAFLDLK